MTIPEAINEIYAVIRSSTETDLNLVPELHLIQDMGLSSVEIMLLLTDLEDHFQINIPVSELRNTQTIDDLCQVILHILTTHS